MRLLHPWNFPGKSTGVDCHVLLQEIFPTQGSNPVSHIESRRFYHLSHQGRKGVTIRTNWKAKTPALLTSWHVFIKVQSPKILAHIKQIIKNQFSNHHRKQYLWQFFETFLNRTTIGSSNPTWGTISQRVESRISKRYLYTHVHNNTIHPRGGSNSKAHRQMNGQTKCSKYRNWNDIQS